MLASYLETKPCSLPDAKDVSVMDLYKLFRLPECLLVE